CHNTRMRLALWPQFRVRGSAEETERLFRALFCENQWQVATTPTLGSPVVHCIAHNLKRTGWFAPKTAYWRLTRDHEATSVQCRFHLWTDTLLMVNLLFGAMLILLAATLSNPHFSQVLGE
ncbi:MAG: hypothetical protein ABIZ80_24540, partial [Bryobacteraceae bacterium]